MRVDDNRGVPAPLPAPAGDGAQPLAWLQALVRVQLGTPELQAAMSQSMQFLGSPAGQQHAEAVRNASLVLAMAKGRPRLGDAELGMVRQWLVDGMSAVQIGAAVGRDPSTISGYQREIERSLGVGRPADWAPVLQELLETGRLGADEAGRAMDRLTAQPDAGPATAWDGLLAVLASTAGAARGGRGAPDVPELRWKAVCGSLGLREVERNALRLAMAGLGWDDIATATGYAPATLRDVRADIVGKLGGLGLSAGQDPTSRMVAAAAFLGALPPDHDRRTVDTARLHVQAATLGARISMKQASVLHDALLGMPLDELKLAHGSSLAPAAFKLWGLLEVPGSWDAGRSLPLLVGRARALGLGQSLEVVAPPGVAELAARVGVSPPTEAPLRAARRPPLPDAAVPHAVFDGKPLSKAAIKAAPSIPPKFLETYRLWQVQHLPQGDCPGANETGSNINQRRHELTELLGNPNARGFLAIPPGRWRKGR